MIAADLIKRSVQTPLMRVDSKGSPSLNELRFQMKCKKKKNTFYTIKQSNIYLGDKNTALLTQERKFPFNPANFYDVGLR